MTKCGKYSLANLANFVYIQCIAGGKVIPISKDELKRRDVNLMFILKEKNIQIFPQKAELVRISVNFPPRDIRDFCLKKLI